MTDRMAERLQVYPANFSSTYILWAYNHNRTQGYFDYYLHMRTLFTTLYSGPWLKFGNGVTRANPVLVSIPMIDLIGKVDMNNTLY